MAEKGILIASQPGGKSVAARDAYELDNNSNPRIIQRFDYSEHPMVSVFPIGTPTRSGITAADSFDLDNLPSQIEANLIDCRDGSNLMVITEATTTGNTSIEITPLLFDGEDPPYCIGVLEEAFVSLSAASYFYRAGNIIVGQYATWPLAGSAKIGIHVSSVNLNGATDIRLWGFVV